MPLSVRYKTDGMLSQQAVLTVSAMPLLTLDATAVLNCDESCDDSCAPHGELSVFIIRSMQPQEICMLLNIKLS